MNQAQIVGIAAVLALGIAGIAAFLVELARQRRETRRYPFGRLSPDELEQLRRDIKW